MRFYVIYFSTERKISASLTALRFSSLQHKEVVLLDIHSIEYFTQITQTSYRTLLQMYYYIVAFLMFPWMSDPYVIVNTEMRYKNFGDCYTTMMKNRSVLTLGLTARYPDLKDYSIRCLDHKTLYELQQNLKQERHEPT